MKVKLNKTLIAGAVVAVLGLASANASAYNVFTFDPPGATPAAFQADKIVGGYDEIITVNGDGTFDVSISWTAGQFYNTNTVPTLKANTGFGVYALFTGSGTITGGGSAFTFNLNPGGSLGLWRDVVGDSVIDGVPLTGASAWGVSNSVDDDLLGTGAATFGAGNLTCIGGNNCGSFGQTTSLALTAAGSALFTSPNPFYNVTFESGQFNGFNPAVAGTTYLNGSLDVTFGVPEPASLALMGLGLLGLGFVRRNRKQS